MRKPAASSLGIASRDDLDLAMPAAESAFGMNATGCAIWFGIIVVKMAELCLITPPIGLNLFVLSSIARAPLSVAVRGVWPFTLVMVGFLFLVTYVPELSLWLPNLVYGN